MSETVFNEKGRAIGQIRNSKLVWTCDEHICTWTNPIVAATKKKNRLEEGKSVSELYGGLK